MIIKPGDRVRSKTHSEWTGTVEPCACGQPSCTYITITWDKTFQYRLSGPDTGYWQEEVDLYLELIGSTLPTDRDAIVRSVSADIASWKQTSRPST